MSADWCFCSTGVLALCVLPHTGVRLQLRGACPMFFAAKGCAFAAQGCLPYVFCRTQVCVCSTGVPALCFLPQKGVHLQLRGVYPMRFCSRGVIMCICSTGVFALCAFAAQGCSPDALLQLRVFAAAAPYLWACSAAQKLQVDALAE
eukprot:1142218-Pelagomonas_calceolata.AAC.1